jgi:serine/threonine protein kinase
MAISRADIEKALGACSAAARVGSQSGSGECWRIEQNGRVFACKVVTKNSEPERFEREVTAMQRVQSPRVARILGRGDLTCADDGKDYPYLLSDFIEGGDVRVNLAAQGPPDDAQLRAFLAGVLEGVEAMHAVKVVHRDLKPENVILLNGDWAAPVIIDLGLSRLVDLSSVTVYPWAAGTWPYMAPEQLRGERAIDRTDLWAIAVMAGELAAGQHPFHRGEQTPPADWHARLSAGIGVPGNRPAGLRDWVHEAGQYAAYRRPTANRSRQRLEDLWP